MARIRPLADDVRREIEDFRERGAALLQLAQDTPPAEIVRRVTERVREMKDQGETLDQGGTIAFGVLLGEQYVRAFGWHWGEVVLDQDGHDCAYCVLSPDDALSIAPLWWVGDVMGRDSTNFMLNFNMVAAGKVPPAEPGQALGFH